VIPNLLKDYCDTLKWAFPLLLAIAFLCLFAVGHLQARVEQDWLDRLRQRNRSQRETASTLTPESTNSLALMALAAVPPRHGAGTRSVLEARRLSR